ncbi:Asp23/Gls24 family envelope stress response protein [Caldalkalibacillus thermarum TA2.A1]|uniref:Asp23/Gls24 family envelope stress response protein n=1 Tax=Caldalkalibacillus thermarum (strain TA2.A1) TaxID=986075 RepID=A0A8X8I276_CALTT|nr:Asp23/Gls24 family envelope stress response protein [Caldalkalibacillus thermarum]QZT32652.1 Asp23/Gls24 family envelope stress response protein [Caldalkalibacillus thermarum TA2.A1]GGK19061.1 alkaline-shock protein [Caldalkalibacillus thermarum]
MDTSLPHVQQSFEIGVVEIAPEVIQVIAGLAASKVDGVAHMNGGFVGELVEKLGRKNLSKGVKVHLGEHHAVIDVSIVVQYGEHIPEVAKQVQRQVKSKIEEMTGLEVLEVNVHIVDVQIPPAGASAEVD